MSVLSTCLLLRMTAKLLRLTHLLRVAVVEVLYPAHPRTRMPALDGSDGSSTRSSGVVIIQPPTERPQGGTRPAFKVGIGGGGGVIPRKRRRPGAQGSECQCQTAHTAKRVVPTGVPGPEQRKGALGAPVGVANQSTAQPPTPQRCFVRPRPKQAETGEGTPSKRRCLGPRATAVNVAATEAPRGRFGGRQRGRH